MSKASVLMLPSTQTHFNLVGDRIRADGWYGFSDGLHTVAIYLNDFRGHIHFEASISADPQEEDWFPVLIGGREFLSFPQIPMFPSGTLGDTATLGYNIVGSFTWLRAKVDRSYMDPGFPLTELDIIKYGYVDRILLNN